MKATSIYLRAMDLPQVPGNQRGREAGGGPFLPSVRDKEKTHTVPWKRVPPRWTIKAFLIGVISNRAFYREQDSLPMMPSTRCLLGVPLHRTKALLKTQQHREADRAWVHFLMRGLGLASGLPDHLLTVSANAGPTAGLSVASHCSSEKVQPSYMAPEASRAGSCPLPRLLHTHSAPPHSTTMALGKGANLSPTSNPFRLLTVQKAPPPASHMVAASFIFWSQLTLTSSHGSTLRTPLYWPLLSLSSSPTRAPTVCSMVLIATCTDFTPICAQYCCLLQNAGRQGAYLVFLHHTPRAQDGI